MLKCNYESWKKESTFNNMLRNLTKSKGFKDVFKTGSLRYMHY